MRRLAKVLFLFSVLAFAQEATAQEMKIKGPGASIDHFFVRGGIEVKQYRILDGDYGVPYISDHYPIEVILSL